MFLFRKSQRTRSPRSSFAGRARLGVEQLESRLVPYAVSGNAWLHPELITLSFVPDGTIVGSSSEGPIASNLFATLDARFGSPAVWQNEVLRAAQVWAQQTNINFAVVADNGAAIGSGLYQQGDPGFSDIRIGGYDFGNSTLAAAYAPPPANHDSRAGDFLLNTGENYPLGSTYDLFTVAVHEIGQALGLLSSTSAADVMFSSYNGVKNSLSSDDLGGIRNLYSSDNARSQDRYDAVAANDSFATATSLTELLDPVTLTALATGLDITTTFIPAGTTVADVDIYCIIAPDGTSGNLSVTVQSSGLSLLAPTLTIYAADQATVLATVAGAGQYGTTLTATISEVTAGQLFYVQVAGADDTALGAGAYALSLNFGTEPSPTVPLPNTQTLNGDPLSGSILTEYGVSTTTAAAPQFSSQTVATDADIDFVVTWSSQAPTGDGWDVYAQLYNAAGEAVGSAFLVNTTTSGDQQNATVAMNANGAFVITWESYGQDSDGWSIFAQWYNAFGVAQGSEVLVNTTTAGDQQHATVATDAAGDFVITWSSSAQDGDGWSVYAQRYDAAGVALGCEFLVSVVLMQD